MQTADIDVKCTLQSLYALVSGKSINKLTTNINVLYCITVVRLYMIKAWDQLFIIQ
jgi:hypothetical protein